MYNVWLTMSFFSQIVTVHGRSMTHHQTDFENFRKIFAAEKCSFQVLLQFIFWTVFPCQDSTSIYGARKLSFAEILLKYSRTLSKLIFNRLKKVCSHLGHNLFNKAAWSKCITVWLQWSHTIECDGASVLWDWRFNFKVNFIFRISKNLNILFLRMKWNKTEYNGIRRKSRSLKLTFPSRFSMTYDSIVITMSDFSQNIIWYLKIFENFGEKIAMKFVSISSTIYNSKSENKNYLDSDGSAWILLSGVSPTEITDQKYRSERLIFTFWWLGLFFLLKFRHWT